MTSLPLILCLLLLGCFPTPADASPDPPSPIDSTQVYYAAQDAAALRRLCQEADDRLLDLLCRYRLYPLTQDPAHLADLPETLADASAPELALLSGLWGYRVMEASIFKIPTYGTRATRLLEQAQALDPEDPFVLLVEGQSLLFRPALFGGDPEAALHCFRTLRRQLDRTSHQGISTVEADLWIWYTLDKLGHSQEAHQLKATLLANQPPPLYEQFLRDPP